MAYTKIIYSNQEAPNSLAMNAYLSAASSICIAGTGV